jgi:AraC-like DNA-binding protein
MSYRKFDLPENGIYLYESIHKQEDIVAGHYHDCLQILYVLDGQGKITIDDHQHNFSKDNIVFIVPYSTHSIEATSKLTVLVLAFSIKKLALKVEPEHSLISQVHSSSKHYDLDPFTASEIRHLLRKILFEQNNNKEAYIDMACSLYVLQIMLTLARLETKSFTDANEMRSIRIREYINSHYFENMTAEALAENFGISTRYMNEIFKDRFHETPMQYLQRIRIDRAKTLLLETDQEIVSI